MGNPLLRKASVSTALCLFLSGCGGGSGGSAGTITTAAVSFLAETIAGGNFSANALTAFRVESFAAFEDAARDLRESDKYKRQEIRWRERGGASSPSYESYSLASARVEYAHAIGLTGAGQIISIVDDGFLTSHESYANRIAGGNAGGAASHGTSVASVAAGNSDYMIGVAPGATIQPGLFDNARSRAAATDLARVSGAVVQNNSWGFPDFKANATDFQRLFVQGDNSIYLTALQNYTQNGVVVFAAENTRGNTVAGLMEALPAFVPELEAGWLAVINGVPRFDNDRILSAQRRSAPCLEAARWCIAADGTWMAATSASDSSYDMRVGTSFAAPMVSGAIALLAEAFPGLTPHDLRARLIATADNGFEGFTASGTLEVVPGSGFFHDYSTEWGHGFLDVRAALLPIGTPVAVLADGTTQSAGQPLIVGGGATGDAVARSLAATPVLVTDVLGGDFTMPGAALSATAAPPPISERLWSSMFGAAPRSGLLQAYGGADMTLRQGGLELALLSPDTGGAAGGTDPAMAAFIGQNMQAAGGEVFVGLNLTRDDGTILPGIGGTASTLAALELAYRRDVGRDGFFEVGGTFGMSPADRGPALTDRSAVQFNAFKVEAGQNSVLRQGDRISLGLSLPVAVTSGGAEIALPVSRSDGRVEHRSVGIDYAPQDREINLSLTYDTPVGRNAAIFVGAIHAANHGNISGQRDTAALLGFRMAF